MNLWLSFIPASERNIYHLSMNVTEQRGISNRFLFIESQHSWLDIIGRYQDKIDNDMSTKNYKVQRKPMDKLLQLPNKLWNIKGHWREDVILSTRRKEIVDEYTLSIKTKIKKWDLSRKKSLN